MSKTIDNITNDSVEYKLNDGREYRAMQLSVTDSDNDTDKIIEGYATVFDTPYLLYDNGDYAVWEVIDKNAFDGCDMHDAILQYDHQGRVFARVKNNTLRLDVDGVGLHVLADLGKTERGRQLYDEVKQGYSDKMSFGFKVAEDERKVTEDSNGHVTVYISIKKISRIYDVSIVSIPANDATEVHTRAKCDGLIAELRADRLKRDAAKRALLLKLKLMEVTQ